MMVVDSNIISYIWRLHWKNSWLDKTGWIIAVFYIPR
jgi:hypothetical protein